jgi:EmrB/QacA subfamily drug resistance transporter
MCLSVAMIVAGVASVNNALPHIAEDLHVSQAGQQWVIDAYAVALAALLLPFGALGDRYGRRLTLVTGISIFGLSSALAATAGSGGALIAARAGMGVGAAFAMPGTLSTITSVFPPESRAKAVGIWAGFAGAGGTLGMLVSGLLLEHFWWGSTFLVNVAVAAVALAMILIAVPSTRSREPVGLDPLGSVLSFVGIGALVLGIIEGPERGWTDPITLAGLIGGAVVLAAFVRAELASRAPLLDPRLFRFRGFATGSMSLFLQFFAMFGFFFVSVQFLQLVLGYSALTAALAIIPMSLVMIPLSTVAATLAERYGQREIGTLGLAISAVGFLALMTLDAGSSYLHLLVGLVIVGAGAALAMTPATNAIVSSLPAAKQGVASAVNDTARELGGAFGIAMLGSAFNVGYRGDIETELSRFPADVAEGAHESPAIAIDMGRSLGDRGTALIDVARDSFVSGMRYAVALGAVLLVVGAVYLWLRGPTQEAEATEDVLDDAPDEQPELVLAGEPA